VSSCLGFAGVRDALNQGEKKKASAERLSAKSGIKLKKSTKAFPIFIPKLKKDYYSKRIGWLTNRTRH
jgi:hypothetical protein